MIRLIVIAALVYFLYRALKSWIFKNVPPIDQGERKTPAGQIDDVMVKDPFCEAYFPKRKGVPLKKDGQLLLFCSQECRDKYIAEN